MDWPSTEAHFARLGRLGVEQQMSRYTALGWILAASLSSPLAAKSESMPAPVATADISGAAYPCPHEAAQAPGPLRSGMCQTG